MVGQVDLQGRERHVPRGSGMKVGAFATVLGATGACDPVHGFTARAVLRVDPLGPVPPGTYDARLVAASFATSPVQQRVVVPADGTVPVTFDLAPAGDLVGWIAVASDGPGHPAGSLRARRPASLTSVVLTGPDGQRRVVRGPAAGPAGGAGTATGTALDACQSREADEARDGLFCFFALPAGESRLTIDAPGSRTHAPRHHVVPGRPSPVAAIVLQPDTAGP